MDEYAAKLLEECRQYVSADHIHHIVIKDGEMRQEPCHRCALLKEIDLYRNRREPQSHSE